jgi:hypothetical protein
MLGGKKGKKDGEKMDSKAIKAAVGGDLRGKKIATQQDEENLASAMFSTYQPKGLQSIKFHPTDWGVLVLVSASLFEEVAKLELTTKRDQKELITLVRNFRYLSKSKYIYTFYSGAKIDTVMNYPGHAETCFASQTIPKIAARIVSDLKSGKLTPTSSVAVSLAMTRTLCAGCATYRVPQAVAALKANPLIARMDVRLSIEAPALTSNTLGAQGRFGEADASGECPGTSLRLLGGNLAARSSAIL